MQASDPEYLIERILAGDRVALARAITLIESMHPDDREPAARLLTGCLPHAGRSVRIAVTGAPGAGKSTFIETLGMRLIRDNRKIAVLAVDPSSSISRGSILGDKTRMHGLAAERNAFIRPSPAADTTGGIARRTREAIIVVEAAGFDTIFVETVGVGQSETTVHTMVDYFLLLVLAGAGDELQGIKRGIIELADGIAITKADGDGKAAAQRARIQFKNALSLFPTPPSGLKPNVHTCSAVTGDGVEAVWESILKHVQLTRESGYFSIHRQEQARHWFHQMLIQRLREEFLADPIISERMAELEDDVAGGRKSASEAAEIVLAAWRVGQN